MFSRQIENYEQGVHKSNPEINCKGMLLLRLLHTQLVLCEWKWNENKSTIHLKVTHAIK